MHRFNICLVVLALSCPGASGVLVHENTITRTIDTVIGIRPIAFSVNFHVQADPVHLCH